MEESSEGVVARHGSFAVPEDVDDAHISHGAVWVRELAHEGGHIVVGDGAGVVDAEGEEGVAECDAVVERVLGFVKGDVGDGDGGGVGAAFGREEGDVVWRVLVGVVTEKGRKNVEEIIYLPGIRAWRR